jgi:hypothetical protein
VERRGRPRVQARVCVREKGYFPAGSHKLAVVRNNAAAHASEASVGVGDRSHSHVEMSAREGDDDDDRPPAEVRGKCHHSCQFALRL